MKRALYEMEDCVENLCCKENLVGSMALCLAHWAKGYFLSTIWRPLEYFLLYWVFLFQVSLFGVIGKMAPSLAGPRVTSWAPHGVHWNIFFYIECFCFEFLFFGVIGKMAPSLAGPRVTSWAPHGAHWNTDRHLAGIKSQTSSETGESLRLQSGKKWNSNLQEPGA